MPAVRFLTHTQGQGHRMHDPVFQYTSIGAGTLLLLFISRRCLFHPQVHGFYRFFAFEALLILAVVTLPVWFVDPLSVHQIISWTLLFVSAGLALHGFHLLRVTGRPAAKPQNNTDYRFEQTAHLVTIGAYRFIRHPLYASLLYLSWGIFLKNLSLTGLTLTLVVSVFLVLTAKVEERENLQRFGESYRMYMHHTRMFVPGLF
jgi:protein-S-isoprenylcysteine O-methyltransferase Ste14